MKNKYAVRSCCYCKKAVEAGAGSVWKWNGRWYGKHAECKKGGAISSAPARVQKPVVLGDAAAAFMGTGESQAEQFAAGLAAGQGWEQSFEESQVC